ncbi:MAG: hypothetical protein L0Y72_20710 [Gemmataceae bacterium]|nr:hypothetical protein [Gemmataceae bacterium]MCI0741462.1 hypothetical protein [Gemmataceae bacterium]
MSATHFYFIRGLTYGDGLRVFKIDKSNVSGAIDGSLAQQHSIANLPAGFSIANGIWIESSTYQTTPVLGLDFVVTGNWPDQDRYLWHIKVA